MILVNMKKIECPQSIDLLSNEDPKILTAELKYEYKISLFVQILTKKIESILLSVTGTAVYTKVLLLDHLFTELLVVYGILGGSFMRSWIRIPIATVKFRTLAITFGGIFTLCGTIFA